MHASTANWSDLLGPARSRLLQALRAGPDEGLHLRELARGTGLSLSSLQRELDRPAGLNVIHRHRVSKRVMHQLQRRDVFAKLLLSACVALELRGVWFDGMPADRDREKRMIDLCAHMPPAAELWRDFGDAAFLAGIAVMLAGHTGYERDAYLALAESLHAGASMIENYERWYQKHRPDFARLLSMIDRERRTHARYGT